ncbi:MAG TPA: IS3 family transposase [Thermomicrobiales bacterium]|nr:IS3 family transposase [Thermomicrobiales bacterium]
MIVDLHATYPELSIRRLCALTGTGRTWYYRRPSAQHQRVRDGEVLGAIVALRAQDAGQSYGYRRITAALQYQGMAINHKRVVRIMREHDLLVRPKRAFVVTTDSAHRDRIYPNLAPSVVLERPNQLWVADITYIQLPTSDCYLACLLDAFSRCCVGWHLDRTLATTLPLTALERAIATRAPGPGLIHHSDRGVQYASARYTDRLHSIEAQISMSRVGNPYDNATVESFYKTLKHEAVYLHDYRTFAEAQAHLGYWIETVYNTQRLHSRLGYRPPVAFEEAHMAAVATHGQ